MGGSSQIIFWLNMILVILVLAILMLGGLVFFIIYKRKKQEEGDTSYNEGDKKASKEQESKMQGREYVQKFMEFDDVIDNMIVRKNRTQYIMVIQCKGVNYDLLSEEEKEAVENGFTQFLNTLRFPIQLYVQTRSLNLREIIDQYKERVNRISEEIDQINIKIKRAKAADNYKMVEKLEFEKRRRINILDYGTDISNYVERMSQNQNVLQQNTYVIVSYYTAEFGGEINNYSKEEIDSICFSELYTRAQTIIRSLSSAEVYGRVLDSEELAELLYVAYNRDESEMLNLKKSLDAEYDSFYSTAPSVLEKKMMKINLEVEQEAAELAAASLLEADKIKMLEKRKIRRVKERAVQMVDEYKDELDQEIYKETLNQIEKTTAKEEKKFEEKEQEKPKTKKVRKKNVS